MMRGAKATAVEASTNSLLNHTNCMKIAACTSVCLVTPHGLSRFVLRACDQQSQNEDATRDMIQNTAVMHLVSISSRVLMLDDKLHFSKTFRSRLPSTVAYRPGKTQLTLWLTTPTSPRNANLSRLHGSACGSAEPQCNTM